MTDDAVQVVVSNNTSEDSRRLRLDHIQHVASGNVGIRLLIHNNLGGGAINPIGARKHAIATNEDQGRFADSPVPVGQKG